MSLILDALKKLDREKSSRRNRTANIAAEILRPDRPHPRRRTSLYFAAVSITIIVTAGMTYALMMKFGFLSKSSPPVSVTSPAARQQAALATPESDPPVKPSLPAPVASPAASQQVVPATPESAVPVKPSPPASVASPGPGQQAALATPESAPPVKPSLPASVASPAASQQGVPATPESAVPVKPSPPASVASPAPSQQAAKPTPSHETVRNAQDQPRRVPPKIEPHAGSKSPATSLDKNKASQNVIPEEAGFAHGIIKRPAEQPPSLPSTPPPSLKISGIVWSEEPSERRAVINGTFTTEGSLIQGVKVVEIFPTSVRFSHQGKSFEISVFE